MCGFVLLSGGDERSVIESLAGCSPTGVVVRLAIAATCSTVTVFALSPNRTGLGTQQPGPTRPAPPAPAGVLPRAGRTEKLRLP